MNIYLFETFLTTSLIFGAKAGNPIKCDNDADCKYIMETYCDHVLSECNPCAELCETDRELPELCKSHETCQDLWPQNLERNKNIRNGLLIAGGVTLVLVAATISVYKCRKRITTKCIKNSTQESIYAGVQPSKADESFDPNDPMIHLNPNDINIIKNCDTNTLKECIFTLNEVIPNNLENYKDDRTMG